MRATTATAAVGPALERVSVEDDGQQIVRYAQALRGKITPPALAANADNYAPAGLGTARIVAVASDGAASRSITGIDISQFPVGQRDGVLLEVFNVGAAQNVTINNENAGSVAANRILTSTAGTLTMLPNAGHVSLMYDQSADGGVGRWRAWQ